jgi:hypothetical protein
MADVQASESREVLRDGEGIVVQATTWRLSDERAEKGKKEFG